MKSKKNKNKVISQEQIFRLMLIMTFAVSGVFLVKNLISQSFRGAAVIGACLVVLVGAVFLMKKLKVSQLRQQFVLSMFLVLIVFVISANSGDFYSDDFPLFLAVLGLSGIYLEPSYTKYQSVLITVILAILYVINPDKADPLSQYIMCVVLFDVAAFTFYTVIKRGRAFIELGELRAQEAEQLIASIQKVGDELQDNCESSSVRIDGMREANERLEANASELKKGSAEISHETEEVEVSCEKVQECVKVTEQQIGSLNDEVRRVEIALSESYKTMGQMDKQMQSVKKTVDDTKGVFTLLQEQMKEIVEETEQLTMIAANTKMLALNASIEAARAGEAGAGFAVVASQVQSLAVDSNNCSDQVGTVVDGMKEQIDKTTERLEESVQAIVTSLDTLQGLQDGFESLITQFTSLYDNIEEQNVNVANVDTIFGELHNEIARMSVHSKENEEKVEAIVEAMYAYQEHMNLVVEDTKKIRELSTEMHAISTSENEKIESLME